MSSRIGYQDLEGKTIAKMVESFSYISFRFTDGTCITIGAEPEGCDEASVRFETTEDYDLLKLEAITQDEYDKRNAAVTEKEKQQRLKQYERLKKEFGQ